MAKNPYLSKMWDRRRIVALAEMILHQAEVYQRIINKDIESTGELKKSVQNSINELCTAMVKNIKNN